MKIDGKYMGFQLGQCVVLPVRSDSTWDSTVKMEMKYDKIWYRFMNGAELCSIINHQQQSSFTAMYKL